MTSEGAGEGIAVRRVGLPNDLVESGALPLGPPLAPVAREAVSLRRAPLWAGAALRSLYVVGALFVFILALEVLKSGAGGVGDVLEGVSAGGAVNILGFGWLGAYLVMSGSPVAAIALTLFAGGTLSDTEAFAMLNGSRLGASFIVLFVGFLLYVGRRRTADGLYIGTVALLTAFTLWLPVLPIGILILRSGWLDAVEVSTPGAITSLTDFIYEPLVDSTAEHLHDLLLFALGVGFLLGAFTLFDRALPNLESAPGGRVERMRQLLHHPFMMFVLGLGITAVTLSVSISLSLLIPLSLRGYVRRDGIIPYVMGANVSTWVDTMVAASLLEAPRAFTIVFTQMVVGAALSLLVLTLAYRPYSQAILAAAHRLTRSRREFAFFLGAILLVPLVLFFS